MGEEFISFWNKKELKPPSLGMYRICADRPDWKCAKLANILENILTSLVSLKPLNHEATLISQFLYRTKKRLRNNKGYKCLLKIHRCLKSYAALDLSSIIEQLRISANGSNGPCKEALEWCLLSVLRFSALFHRVQNTCLESANHFYIHLITGNNWNIAVLLFASLSRVCILSQYCVNIACEWYLSLKTFIPHLAVTEQWLPLNYELPADLKTWLGDPEYLRINTRIENVEEKIEDEAAKCQNFQTRLALNEDLGEVIPRKNVHTPAHKRTKFRNENDRIFLKKKKSH